jgi:hypothetical protein
MAKGRQPDVPQITAIDLSEASTDDASNSIDASGETVDPVDSTEVPSLSQEFNTSLFIETPPVQPPLLRNFLEVDELFVGMMDDASSVEHAETPPELARVHVELPPPSSSLRGIDVDNHAAIASLVARLHANLLADGLDSGEEAAKVTPRRVPPVALRKRKGLKVSFSDGSPEVRFIEGLQARREELRLWDIAEFLEMRREAMASAGMLDAAIDDHMEATGETSYVMESSSLAWHTAGSYHPPRQTDSERILPLSLFWCCSSAPPNECNSPFVHELENDCYHADSEALPDFPERQQPPCTFSPRQAVSHEQIREDVYV